VSQDEKCDAVPSEVICTVWRESIISDRGRSSSLKCGQHLASLIHPRVRPAFGPMSYAELLAAAHQHTSRSQKRVPDMLGRLSETHECRAVHNELMAEQHCAMQLFDSLLSLLLGGHLAVSQN
jgi:hypothetical protein